MTKLEQEREAIKKKPKNFANLLDLMRSHASMLEVYEYVEGFERELREKLEKSFSQSELLRLKAQFILGTEEECKTLGNMELAYRFAIKMILGGVKRSHEIR